MEFSEVLRRRRMIRTHSGEAVDAETLIRIASALERAPSAGWSQAVTGVLVTEPQTIAAIAEACEEPRHVARGLPPWLSTAAGVLVVCVEPERYRERYSEPDKDPSVLETVPWWWVDAGASLMAVLLAAVDAGISAGFLGGHRASPVGAMLGIPDHALIVGLITLGPPGRDTRSSSLRRPRRSDVVRRERW